jgi:hypothetical protein
VTLEDNIAGGQVAQKRKFSVFPFSGEKVKNGKASERTFCSCVARQAS